MSTGHVLLEQLQLGRVAILGDLMLDAYVAGEVARISPEAPVPVLHVAHERNVPGGAANVAANIAAMGGGAVLLGLLGADSGAEQLARLLAEMPGIQLLAQRDASRSTTIKTRYVAGQQQIVRVDRETAAPASDQVQMQILADLESALNNAAHRLRVLVLSDYGKGVLTDRVVEGAIAMARGAGCTVVVDPKRRDFSVYRGADFITPNRKELTDATGLPCREDDEAAEAAAVASAQCGAAVLLTRSERGMSLFRPGLGPIHMPTEAREVFDVSGAGDTVAAAFALALAAEFPIETAMRLANTAAGIVVGKRGTATVSPEELRSALIRRSGASAGPRPVGLISLAEAVRLRGSWRAAGQRVGFTNGCFDLLHPGHVSLIRQAAAACDRLIVAINTDASVRRLKGPSRPVQSEAARAEVLAALRGVDAVIAFGEDTPLEVIEALEPDLLVKGADYSEDQVVGAAFVKARGGRVLLAQLVEGQSTTSIVRRAAEPEG